MIPCKCARACKCGCPVALQLRHASCSTACQVREMEAHQGHGPAAADERPQLKVGPAVRQVAVAVTVAEEVLAQAQLPHNEAQAGEAAQCQAGQPEGQRRAAAAAHLAAQQ